MRGGFSLTQQTATFLHSGALSYEFASRRSKKKNRSSSKLSCRLRPETFMCRYKTLIPPSHPVCTVIISRFTHNSSKQMLCSCSLNDSICVHRSNLVRKSNDLMESVAVMRSSFLVICYGSLSHCHVFYFFTLKLSSVYILYIYMLPTVVTQ